MCANTQRELPGLWCRADIANGAAQRTHITLNHLGRLSAHVDNALFIKCKKTGCEAGFLQTLCVNGSAPPLFVKPL